MKMKKIVATGSALALTAAVAVGATLAYLQDQTDTIKNTFTVGKVDLDLTETGAEGGEQNYDVVPGGTYTKDPTIIVKGNSENSYVFVRVTETNNADDKIEWTIANGWTALPEQDGVYYREYTKAEGDTNYQVLACVNDAHEECTGCVSVSENWDGTGDAPTLTFQGYAVQKDNVTDVNTAWTIATTPNA